MGEKNGNIEKLQVNGKKLKIVYPIKSRGNIDRLQIMWDEILVRRQKAQKKEGEMGREGKL